MSARARVVACARRILSAPEESAWDEDTRSAVRFALEMRCDADRDLLQIIEQGAAHWSGTSSFASWLEAFSRSESSHGFDRTRP